MCLYGKTNPKSSTPEILSTWPQVVECTGISEYEAKIYLCLLNLGSGSARQLSMFSGIPRTKIYGILKNLIDLGFVSETSGHPKYFIPLSPDAFRPVTRIFSSRIEDFNLIFKILAEADDAMKTASSSRKGFVWYLDRCSEILDKCRNLLQGSKREVAIIANGEGVALLFYGDQRILDDLKERGVSVNLYSPLDPERNSLARELSYIIDVRKVEFSDPFLFLHADHEEFLLASVGGSGSYFEEALVSDDPILTKLIFLLWIDGLSESKTLHIKGLDIQK